jgi:hypothetical protein
MTLIRTLIELSLLKKTYFNNKKDSNQILPYNLSEKMSKVC